MLDIRKLEVELWESADLLRAGSKLTSNQYCMPVLGLIFLRYAYSRFKMVEAEILKDRPTRGGRVMPVQKSDFISRSALYLPKEAQYSYLVNLPENISTAEITNINGDVMNSLGEVVNNAMELVEQQSDQLIGVLPKDYTMFSDELLTDLLRIFNNSALDDVGGDIIGRIYEYFLNKFASNIAQDDGVFFTPKSLVKMIVNVLEPKRGILLDPACGSGGMFVQTGDFVEHTGMRANNSMTFYGQEKVSYNAQLCLMNLAVHGLSGSIKSGDEANTFYHDAHNLEGRCDYIMANPPFNVNKIKSESAQNAGRLPFGLPSVNKNKEFSNANYLWISYFYAYLNEHGRAGFVMASSATDSQSKDIDIRQKLIETGHVDVMVSVGNNFFYTRSLPCSLWFFDKGKQEQLQDKVLFIDARNYYTVVDRTLNEWSQWQLKNLNAIVWLYRGEKEKYRNLLTEYQQTTSTMLDDIYNIDQCFDIRLGAKNLDKVHDMAATLKKMSFTDELESLHKLKNDLNELKTTITEIVKTVINSYTAMSKSEYKTIRENFKKINGFALGTISALKKSLNNNVTEANDKIDELLTVLIEAEWLYEKFGAGEYKDIAGLCKIADVKEIKTKNYSLTPGVYVGVAVEENDDEDFKERMAEIHKELIELQVESNKLMQTISKNWEELGL